MGGRVRLPIIVVAVMLVEGFGAVSLGTAESRLDKATSGAFVSPQLVSVPAAVAATAAVPALPMATTEPAQANDLFASPEIRRKAFIALMTLVSQASGGLPVNVFLNQP